MWLIAGLGNPGKEYEETRHNAGALVVEALADRHGIRLNDKKFKARLGKGRIGDEDVVLIEPQTFMNLSGEAVGPAAGFFKVAVERVIAVHDELDLGFGVVEPKAGGGHRGHNGLRSLHKHLPNERYLRVRVGIGRPPAQWDPADYVLSRFTRDERSRLDEIVTMGAETVEIILEKGGVEPRRARGKS